MPIGLYTPTAVTVTPQWPELTPFAMTSPSQFRPKPPIALESEQWAKDYNEIKELGAKNSGKRSPQQTEDARFRLLTGRLSRIRCTARSQFEKRCQSSTALAS